MNISMSMYEARQSSRPEIAYQTNDRRVLVVTGDASQGRVAPIGTTRP